MFNPLPENVYRKSGSYYLPRITFCTIEPNVCYRFKSHVFHTYCDVFFFPLPTSISPCLTSVLHINDLNFPHNKETNPTMTCTI